MSALRRTRFGLLLALVTASACRQPSADIQLTEPQAEPSSRAGAGPSVIVEAPTMASSGLVLDHAQVDDSLAGLIDGPRMRVDYEADHPWIGAAVPLVTIVVFGDYECPYCAKLNQTLDELLRDYPDSLRIVHRQFPLPMHSTARSSAGIALAAHGRGRFADVHDYLVANRRPDRTQLASQLASLGLDSQLLLDEVDAGFYDDRIDADIAFGKRFEVRATPTFFVNGRLFSGAQPRDAIEGIVQEELLLAKQLIAAGSAPEQVWARIMAASATEPQAAPKPPEKRYATALANLPKRGAATPKVEILMCGDFDCPYCSRAVATLEQLLVDHPSDVAIYFRNHPLPMHKHARAAHRAAVAADNQGQFWPMFELLFANAKQRSDAELEAMAKQLKLDLKRFRRDIADAQTDARIDAELAFCEQDLDARGTPTFFINGRKLVGAQPISAFETIIQEELTGRGPP